jgi:hypothetical protein
MEVFMRFVGFVVLLVGVWWTHIWWLDPVEGKLMRPLGVLLSAGGLLLYFEGLKNAIVARLLSESPDVAGGE